MAAKMTVQQWEKARRLWEADARPGYAWLVREMALPVSRVAVSRRAKADGWEKRTLEAEGAGAMKGEPEVTQEVTPTAKVTQKVTQEVTPAKGAAGRPSDYREEYADQAERLCLLGFTRERLAEFFGVDERTVYRWQEKNARFRHAIWRGGALADAEVAHGLFNRAKGAVVPETHVSNYQGEITRTEIDRHYPPETAAARLWLKNRQPELWKDKVEVEDKPDIAIVDSAELGRIYHDALDHAAKVEQDMRGRAERLGLVLDGEFSSSDS